MGDGRYYSLEQFFSIMVLTSLIIIMTISIMLSLYKVEKYKKTMAVSSALLGLSILSSFIATITYLPNKILLFYALSTVFLVIYLLLMFVFYVYHFTKSYDRPILIIFFALYCLPTILFLLNPELKYFMYPLFVSNSVVLSNKFFKYPVSSSVFSDVKKLMLDYVFIIGINGDIIYQSDKISASKVFKKLRTIDIGRIEDIFYKDILIRNTFGKQFIKIVDTELFYFQYHKKEIYDKGKIAGYILTFADITELIAMLDELRNKQMEMARMNAKLIKNKEIVYSIEREKEIENLFDEIVGSQQEAMEELKNNIENLNNRNENFIPEIEKLIAIAKANLKDVRDVVTTYSCYYEEGGYDD